MDEAREEHFLFKSLSSPIRLRILQLLDKQPLSYTELMKDVGMGRKTASGRFAHHLRILIASGLIRTNEKTKLYELTPKGSQVVKSLQTLRHSLSRGRGLTVRKSGLFIEKFDRNKIAQVLVDEAGMPAKTADKLARLAEEKLESLRIEYLTASLIRELVNALLIDQGLEQYRHRLTRLGMPVYDVDKLLEEASRKQTISSLVRNASNAVYREYVLQAMLPREAVDAYLSGDVELEGVETWAFSVYSRFYYTGREELSKALAEAEAVEREIVIDMSDEGDRDQLLFFLQSPSIKHLTVSIYTDHPDSMAGSFSEMGLHVLAPAEKLVLKNFSHVELVVSKRPASAEGHSFPPSGIVDGKAAVNLVGLYLKSGADEKSFWNSVNSAVHTVVEAFKKKKDTVSRFWTGLQGYFILSFVGLEEIQGRLGLRRLELVKKLWTVCRDAAEGGLIVLPSGQSSRKTAERLRHLDVLRFGGREVAQLAPANHYSWSLNFGDADEVLEAAKYLPGGFRASLTAEQAERVLGLGPMVLLSPGPKA
ncbi:MAG: ArsR family transcriptional regulator [Candidatus Caldarchaeum sp.]|nr:ArsR family transcriptional regulator [Candidatus Caldarchaeum sp.]